MTTIREAFSKILGTDFVNQFDEYWQNLVVSSTGGLSDLNITAEIISEIRYLSNYMYLTNPSYRGIIRTYIKYIGGKDYDIDFDSDSDLKNWSGWQKKHRWKLYFREIILRFFKDGEVFIDKNTWEFISPGLISSPGLPDTEFGIIQDTKTSGVGFYCKSTGDGYWDKIPAEEIIHVKDATSDISRGLPYLFSILLKANDYDKWLHDRIMLNRIRSSIALLRKHTNISPTQGKTFADSKATTTDTNSYGESRRRKMYEPGTILDVPASTDYQFLSPNVNAADVADDGRTLRLTFSAATGLPEFMISGDASNSNYASTMIAEGPGIKEFEDWQTFFSQVILDIWEGVKIQNWKDYDVFTPRITPPSLVTRDKLKDAQTNQILYSNKVISIEEWQRRENIDSDQMAEEISKESEDSTMGDETEDEEDELAAPQNPNEMNMPEVDLTVNGDSKKGLSDRLKQKE